MNAHDELERLLGEELQDRAGDIGGARLHLSDVQGRASRIRRNRRIGGAVVAAAVVALAVPVGINVIGDGTTNTSPPVAPSPDAPKPTPQADGSFRLTLEGLSRGEAARVGYIRIDDKQLTMPAGTFDIPEAYSQILPYRTDGWLALRGGNFPPYGYRVAELGEDFDVVQEAPAGPGMAVDGASSKVAWVEADGNRSTLVVQPTDGSEPTRDDIGPGMVSPVGFLPDDRVVLSVTDQSTGEETSVVVEPDGGSITQLNGFLRVNDASEVTGLVAGQTDYRTDGTSCAGVQSDGVMLWEGCDYTLGQFSPDGRYVVGLASQYDGPGSPTLSILDAMTGEPLVDYRPTGRQVTGVDQVVWETPDTVLATVTQGRDQALLRADLEGRLELVDGPLRTGGMEIEFRLAEYPNR